MKYLKNPGVTLSPFHGAGSRQRYLCEIPRSDGSMRRDLVDSEFADLLALFDGTRELDTVLAEHRRSYRDSRYTVVGLEKLIGSYCAPTALLIDPGSGSAAVAAGDQAVPAARYMYAKCRLLPHNFVYPVVRRLSWLYSRPTVVLVCGLSVLLHLWLYWRLLPASRFNIGTLSGQQLLSMTALLIGAAFCHELGHATALAAHGCRRLQIGLGLYLYLPVLYTDVSEAWRLKPMQRVQVDAGGVYFHSISQILLLASFFFWHKLVFLYAIFMIDVTITSSLNPFLRMDGYWLLSDLCGLWNLRRQSLDLARQLWRRVTGRPQPPGLSEMTPRSVRILVVYSILLGGFCGYLLSTLAYQLVVHVIPGYPGLWLSLARDILHPATLDAGQLLTRIFELLWKTFLMIGAFFFVRNGLRRGLAWIGSRRRRPVGIALPTAGQH